MTEIKHTPGPWSVAHKGVTGNVLVDAGPYYVCTCWHYHGSVEKEMNANARLIAAAPELLEACRTMVAWSDAETAGPDYGTQNRDTHPDAEAILEKWWDDQYRMCARAFDTARAAIAKAEGRS